MSKAVFNNGVHDITNAQYHASEGVSRSALWKLKRSPYHYWYEYLNPDFVKPAPGKDFILGNLVHTMALEPEKFDEQYMVKPTLDPLPKVGLLKDLGREEYDRQKAQREAISVANDLAVERFNEALNGQAVIEPELYKQAMDMTMAVSDDDVASGLISDAKIEKSIYFTHKPTGIQCKVRPDVWLGSVVMDLKTTADGSERAFKSSAYKNGYFLQCGMIAKALESIGESMEKFVFTCVEKTEPYCVANFVVDDAAIDYGVQLFDDLMSRYAECLASDRWPAYGLQTLTVPGWAKFDEI